ncbi:BTB/POZ domain motif-containing protein [Pandoravirus inopinatum]|uniref:BTB/POZ domain motif-containing protein n=1 Tax=Pandoravirus inopinatum TaxID=1605721 RepID=A0A0B5IVV9_9VIRU|nr:BTB/POZ domain motif-containing protein [Pandoravirus inopinatum]AJF96798.1 BTB/POZ domain motif-containing protein [Pandoravirus inopinatum]
MYTSHVDAVRCLRKMRHRLCDCVIELGPRGADARDDAVETITAHRTVLARWPYFRSLFARADPVRIDVGTGDAKGVCRVVYSVVIPFAASSVRALVDMAYDNARVDLLDDSKACDPVDVIKCAIYLGVGTRRVHALVANVIETLLAHLPTSVPDGGARTESADVGAFVLHMLAADLEESTKRRLVARLYYLMSDADRATAAETYRDMLLPPLLYGMETVPPSGLRVCCDRIVAPCPAPRVIGSASAVVMVDFRQAVVNCTDGIVVTLRIDSAAAAFWHCRMRFLHPIEKGDHYTSMTVHTGTPSTWTFAEDLTSDVLGVYRSSLTVCEVDMWPAL